MLIVDLIYIDWRQNSNIKLLQPAQLMSKKICFSSVLKQKRGSQNILNKQSTQSSLRDMMEEFATYPNGDFTLRYFATNSLKACNSKQGFDEGYNQLDQWIHNQKIHSNKENISDTQPRRHIPNELLKYANAGPKSPRRLSQVKSDLTGPYQNAHRNADMKQICRQYVENKKNGRDVGKEAPVWRFAAKNQDKEYEEEIEVQKRAKNFKETEQMHRQSVEENFKLPGRLNQKQNNTVQVQKITSAKNNLQAPKSQSMMKIVQQIKNNLVPQIEVMAERIIQEKALGQEEDQELLISQRESEEQRDQKRFDKVRKEVGEYLSRKSCSSDQRVQQTSSVPLKKAQDESFDRTQQKGSNQHVGYSFSSDFQNPSMPQQSCKNVESYHKQENRQQPPMIKIKKETQSYLNQCNKISLPNIDEVKSERDAMEKMEQYFGQSLPLAKPQIQSSIDKNFIKQIQSVAYVEPAEHLQVKNKARPEQLIKERQQTVLADKGEKKSSLFQQISKTAMSIEGIQENNSVNVSVAEGKQSPLKLESQKGSAKNDKVSPVTTAAEVSGFVVPAQSVKIQFKKIPSPERIEKQQQKPQVSGRSTGGSNYFSQVQTSSISPSIQQPTNPTQPTPNYSIGAYKTSFSNILHQSQKQPVFVNHQQTTTTYNNQVYPSSTTYQQNSRQRGNSLKNSNQQDQGRKLKITISPKYHGKEEDKYESIGNVADFKLNNAKMEESTQPQKQPNQASLTVAANPMVPVKASISTAYPTSVVSVPAKQSMGGDKFKIDGMLTNVRNLGNTSITETREIHQESRDRAQEHTLIRVEKYERVEKIVENKNNKQSISQKNNTSIKSSQQFQFDLDF